VFSGFLAYLFLNESIGVMHLFSALLIVAGILIANRVSKKLHPITTQDKNSRE